MNIERIFLGMFFLFLQISAQRDPFLFGNSIESKVIVQSTEPAVLTEVPKTEPVNNNDFTQENDWEIVSEDEFGIIMKNKKNDSITRITRPK